MSHGADQLTGRGRIILSVAVVALLAVVAAVATVVISSATYDPTPRTLSPKTQVAAGSDHVDAEAGVEVRVPEGWRVEPGDLVYGSTALVPEPVDGLPPGQTGGGIVLVGALTPNLFAAHETDNQRSAAAMSSGMGEYFLPVPGQRTEQRMEEISSDLGDGWAMSYRVVPDRSLGATSATGAAAGGLVYAAVVGEGEQRYWLTYVGTPGDGAMESPGREWADEIVERLHRTEGDDDVAAVENAPGQTA